MTIKTKKLSYKRDLESEILYFFEKIMWIGLGIVAALVAYAIFAYNNIIKLQNNRDNAFSDIDVQLKQRFDLLPNLIETVKGYMAHEKGVLETVTKARTEFMNAGSVSDKIGAENMLSGALKSLFAVSENYPDLKANTNFMHLQSEMADIENKIAAARRFFNNATKEYNNGIEVFPANMIAGSFGFKQEKMFEVINAQEKENIAVKF